MEIIDNFLKDGHYYKEDYQKRQIVLHHTAGNKNAQSSIDWWNSGKDRVGTAFIIDYNGKIFRCFPEDYWAFALGLKTANRLVLEKYAVQIEMCAWGQLKKVNNEYYNYLNKKVDSSEVYELETLWKNEKYFHKYSDNQINSLKELLNYLCDKYKIKKEINEDIFGLNNKALSGDIGIYAHCSYRKDKYDIYPDKRILNIF